MLVISLCLAIAALNFAGVNSAPPEKIVRGHSSDIRKFPHLVSLRQKWSNFHFCGGSIISPKYILTAAHCLVNQKKEGIIVVIGSSMISRDGFFYSVQDFSYSRNYKEWKKDHTAFYDIAIITLSKQLDPLDKFWKPIRMASRDYPENYPAIFAGWGDQFQNATTKGYITKDLIQFETHLAAISDCQNYISSVRENYHVCTLPIGGKSICQGDSGGPLIVNNEVVGVASFVGYCGFSASVFAKVRTYKSYIQQVTGIKI